MLKRQYLACMDLHKKLKDSISGNIFITIDDNDTLIVYINAAKGIRYKFEHKYISYEKLENKFNCDRFAKIINYKYREFIINKFFRRDK